MRRLLTTISVLLLLAITWSQALAASLCLHTQAAHSCCFVTKTEHKQYQSAHNEGMTMPGMDAAGSVGMDATQDAQEEDVFIGQSMKDCAPCVQTSPLQTTTLVTGFVDQSKRDLRMAAPLGAALLAPVGLTSALSASSRPHAPPGNSSPRYTLINVLRI